MLFAREEGKKGGRLAETKAEREELTAEMKKIAKHPQLEEMTEMSKTFLELKMEKIEEESAAKAALNAKREVLIQMLTLKFKTVPVKIKNRIMKENEMTQIESWIENAVFAESLGDVGIA
jgi:hypothetical protein